MKLQTIIGNHTTRPFMLIAFSLLIVVPLCSGACVTPRAMDYARAKASPLNATEFTIGKVHSAEVHENSDISVIVELNHPTHPKSGLYAIKVPHPFHVENADAIESFGFRVKYTPSISGLPGYLYPMGKAKKVPEKRVQMKDSRSSPIQIEELTLYRDETERVVKLVGDLSRDAAGEKRIYTVNLLSDAIGKAAEEEPGKNAEKNATIEKTILLVHLPPLGSNSHPQTIAITGAYEDESTNLYYLLVPPAVAVDAFLIALAIAGHVAQGASGASLSFH